MSTKFLSKMEDEELVKAMFAATDETVEDVIEYRVTRDDDPYEVSVRVNALIDDGDEEGPHRCVITDHYEIDDYDVTPQSWAPAPGVANDIKSRWRHALHDRFDDEYAESYLFER